MGANLLSASRVALIPFLLYSLWRDGQAFSWLSFGLLLLAAATDIGDGYVARHWGQTSNAGKILDPLADKLVLGSLGIGLVCWRGFPLWLVLLLLARDLVILAVGLYLWRRQNLVIPANRLGKHTTVCMGLLILSYVLPVPAFFRPLFAGIAFLLILASSFSYWQLLRQTPLPPNERNAS